MTYETASASDPNNLLDKLRIFALAAGWTVDYYGNRTNAGGGSQGNGLNALAMNKGGCYWVLYHDASSNSTNDPTPRILGYTYPGPWVGTNGSDLQVSRTSLVASNNIGGPYVAYHFFTDSAKTYLHAVVEVVSGRFAHLGLGLLDKAGGGAAVPYAYGLRWNFNPSNTNQPNASQHCRPWNDQNDSTSNTGTVLRADSDGVTPRNFEMRAGAATRAGGGWTTSSTGVSYPHLAHRFMALGPSAITGRAPLVPAMVLIERSAGVLAFAGAPFDLRLIRMDNLTPGAVITIGSDSWKVFPVIRKNGPAGVENSGAVGYAFRVV